MSRILLVGSGQSGSTLLGMGLALSPEISMLGEISELGRVDPEQHACTCGPMFGACPLWGTLFREGRHLTPFAGATAARIMERAREVDGTRACVDSCKNEEALRIELSLGLSDVRILYLVRHPCGYVYSQLWNGYELQYALDAWIAEQERLLSQLAALNVPHLVVRYEELARQPGAELGRVGAWLGVLGPDGARPTAESRRPWDFERAPWGARQHVLSGAAWRYDGRPKVEEDKRWQQALRPRDVSRIVEQCGALLQRLGYVE